MWMSDKGYQSSRKYTGLLDLRGISMHGQFSVVTFVPRVVEIGSEETAQMA